MRQNHALNSLHAVIEAIVLLILERLILRLENLFALWKAGELPLPTPRVTSPRARKLPARRPRAAYPRRNLGRAGEACAQARPQRRLARQPRPCDASVLRLADAFARAPAPRRHARCRNSRLAAQSPRRAVFVTVSE